MTHPYATLEYAASLAHVGRPIVVPSWGTHVIAREIGDSGGREDVVGCYPITVLAPDADVAAGLADLRTQGFVTVGLVVDDVHRPPVADLEAAFDFVRPFKTHHVFRREHGPFAPDKHHRYEIKRARARVEAVRIDLAQHLDAWGALYATLAGRHALAGTHDFSRDAFARLSRIEGVEAIGGFVDGRLVCCHLWVVHDTVAHSHLMASDEVGYRTGAAYAVNEASIRLIERAAVFNFGGGAGVEEKADDGLARFKRGFANATALARFCGAVLDPSACDALVRRTNTVGATYFPAYRSAPQTRGDSP